MKRINSILAIALCLIFFASCEKDPAKEWDRFYGFAKEDVIGHYEPNPDESLYEELPTEGVKVYSDAVIDVVDLSDNLVSIRIRIPSVPLNKVFSGVIYSEASNSDIVLNSGNDDIRMTVYKNDKGQVRFHGRQKRYYYDADHVLVDSDNYGFDVIKEE